MDRVVRISECRPDQAVGYVSQCLTDEALYWWENVEQSMTEDELAGLRWMDMKELIRGRFCAEAEVEKAEVAFLALEAGTKTHREYTSEFNRLSRLVPAMVDTDA